MPRVRATFTVWRIWSTVTAVDQANCTMIFVSTIDRRIEDIRKSILCTLFRLLYEHVDAVLNFTWWHRYSPSIIRHLYFRSSFDTERNTSLENKGKHIDYM